MVKTNKFSKKKRIIASVSGVLVAMLASLVIMDSIPGTVYAEVSNEETRYQYDEVEKPDVSVYSVSLLGVKREVKNYDVSTESLDDSGTIQVQTASQDVQCDVNVIKANAINIQCDTALYEGETVNTSAVKEVISYEDGAVKELADENVTVSIVETTPTVQTQSTEAAANATTETTPAAAEAQTVTVPTFNQDEENKVCTIKVSSITGEHTVQVPVIGIVSLTTVDPVYADQTLSQETVRVLATYADGSTKELPAGSVSFEAVENPHPGTNEIPCTYQGKSYVLTVESQLSEAQLQAAASSASDSGSSLGTINYSTAYYVGSQEEASSGADVIAPSSDPLTPSKGVVYYNGHRETYYSQNVLPGGALSISGRHVAEDGTVRDGDGYICVASSDLAWGTIVETSLGTAKVYDSGCASGTIDIYTNW